VVKGKEHQERENPEQAAVGEYGGRLLFGSGEVRFSSLDLLRREYVETNFSTIRKPQEYAARHGFSVDVLKRALPAMAGMKVLVIGDLIVDEYVDCDPLGMSQEDPTIVVTPINRERFVGGAAIVAAHARGLGAEVRFFSVAGADETKAFAAQLLREYSVEAALVNDEGRPTTLKQRFRASGKTLLRVSHLRQHPVSPEIADALFAAIEPHVSGCDLIIFADFNYGCLPQPLVDRIVALGARHHRPMAADSQASSQLSDISRFKGMMLITPTEREARLALRDFESGLVVLAEKLRRAADAENVVITLGNEGLLVHARSGKEYLTDRLPAFNLAPKDTAGAGDSFTTCSAMALCRGLDPWQAVYLGSLAAACQVGRVGNLPLTQRDLLTEIDQP
jgi:rfaE bifunctional protein kinase chain/domain